MADTSRFTPSTLVRHIPGIVFIILVAIPYLAIMQSPRKAEVPVSGKTETLMVISPHRREVRQEYDRGFGSWMRRTHNRNVRIEWLDVGGTSKILKDLESRYAKTPDKPGVDMLFGGGVDPYLTARDQGWLERVALSADILAAIPATCGGSPVYDRDLRWFGVALSGFGIVYNKQMLTRLGVAEPRSWSDLGKPELFTWIASGDPRSSGSVHMCYEIILQTMGFENGWSLITRICANVRRFGEGGSIAPNEVAAGEAAAGMAIDQYAQTVIDINGRDNLSFILPDGATTIGADAIAVLRNAPSRELAELFLNYVLSEDGQRLLYTTQGVNGQEHSLRRLPVRKALYAGSDAPAARPYDNPGGFIYNGKTGSARRKVLADLIGVYLIDSHKELAYAWGSIIKSGMDEKRVQVLCKVPLSEKELLALSAEWKDPRKRLMRMTSWAEQAGKRYREASR
ncbi:MAG: extracellular solute-binding protein [Spirochaetes bacterium]|nr:extracellular solute-binding protein [Spirochaetota bacterium]